MKEVRIYCDQCHKDSPWYQVSVRTSRSELDDKHFCDRLCLIKWFEENPAIWKRRENETA